MNGNTDCRSGSVLGERRRATSRLRGRSHRPVLRCINRMLFDEIDGAICECRHRGGHPVSAMVQRILLSSRTTRRFVMASNSTISAQRAGSSWRGLKATARLLCAVPRRRGENSAGVLGDGTGPGLVWPEETDEAGASLPDAASFIRTARKRGWSSTATSRAESFVTDPGVCVFA